LLESSIYILSLKEGEVLKEKLLPYLDFFKKLNYKKLNNKLIIVSYQKYKKKNFAFFIRKLRLDFNAANEYKFFFKNVYYFEFFNKKEDNKKKFNFASDIAYLNYASSLILLDNVKLKSTKNIVKMFKTHDCSMITLKKNFSCDDIIFIKSLRLREIYDFHSNSSKKIRQLLLGNKDKFQKINNDFIFYSNKPFFKKIKKDIFSLKRDSTYFVGTTIYDNYPHYIRNNFMTFSLKFVSHLGFYAKRIYNTNKYIDLSMDTFLKGSSLMLVKISLIIPNLTFQLLKIYKYIVARIIYDKIANKFLFLGLKMPKFILRIYNLDQIVVRSMTRIRRRQYLYLYLKNITNEKS